MDFSEEWSEYIAWLDRERQAKPREWFRSLVRHDRWRTAYWLCRQVNLYAQESAMRGKTKPQAKKPVGAKQWTTFVEISLAGHSLEDVNTAFGDPDTLSDAIQTLAQAGYRISLSHSPANDAMIASVTCKAEGDTNEGCTMTSFAMDWVTALRIACYKHFVVAKEDWGGAGSDPDRPMFG
jgi:hypothetical protein